MEKGEIKNLKRAARRIKQAIKKNERIILYGDADLDGVTSVIILKESIQSLGGKVVAVYFPEREKEGYGISKTGLNNLKRLAPALLISLDFGISNLKEVDLAKKLGFETIIIDHHEVLEKLPNASVIVNPKQKGDNSFKGFSTGGIVYKLSGLLLGSKMTASLRKNFLELAALSTIADMMPREKENKVLIEEGLRSIENSWRPGMRAFFEMEPFKNYGSLNEKVSKIISILNVRDLVSAQNKAKEPTSFRVLTASSVEEAKEIIKELLEKNKIRKKRIEEIVEEIEEKLLTDQDPIIFMGSSEWEFSLISSVASIICRRHKKPTFIFKKAESESIGTVRAPEGVDSVLLMKRCSQYLVTFGGHPPASGFRIKNKNLEEFRKCLLKNI